MEQKKEYKPYVPEQTDLKEFTLRAVIIGVILSVLLGAANAYLGLRAGMTVAATFPAAVVAMAVLRIFRGNILEENLARAAATVGEALVAGAIFTIPAFILAGVWTDITYRELLEMMMIMLIGGILGVLFVIALRRPLISSPELLFPESVACAEIVKSGQGGSTGAGYVFGAAGFASLLELFKNEHGLRFINEYKNFFKQFSPAQIQFLDSKGNPLGGAFQHQGGMYFSSPAVSPAFMGVGYIIGTRLASITFAGGVFGWLLLIPLLLFINNSLTDIFTVKPEATWLDIGRAVWYFQVRPIAVGAMIVGAGYTLWKMRKNLTDGIGRAIKDVKEIQAGRIAQSRIESDIPFNRTMLGIVVLLIPIMILYWYFSRNIIAAVVAGLTMAIAGFFFSAVAGYLVGIIGSSSNPISGLTLSSLLIAAILMVMLGVSGNSGIAAVLGVAAVVCCTLGIAGDVMQDLKIGHMLGGTPRLMEKAALIGVVFAAIALPFVLLALHKVYVFGSDQLPAPQAGLMAMLAKGIVTHQMAWPLIIVGMFFSFGLILIKSPSPMLIAVGMYLPFYTTFAIFLGGVTKFIIEKIVERKKLTEELKTRVENKGILIASGFVAGESLMGIILAGIVLWSEYGRWFTIKLPSASSTFVSSVGTWIGMLVVIPILALTLIYLPLRGLKKE
jgi:putative OPT family oligopeptide transporter